MCNKNIHLNYSMLTRYDNNVYYNKCNNIVNNIIYGVSTTEIF